MNARGLSISLALTLGLLALTGALIVPGAWSSEPPAAQAQSGAARYVAPTGVDDGDCTNPASPCRTVQYAVNQAGDGDVVKVAMGIYTGVQNVPGLNTATFTATQVAVITKTLTIQGGYTTTNTLKGTDWTTAYPITQPTTLDAQGQGRVLCIIGSISPTIEGLRITGGDAVGLGGTPWAGVDAGGGMYVLTATATIRNCQAFSNTAEWYGGGLYLKSSAATLSGNTIFTNTAKWCGGGLFLDQSNATLNGNVITTNTASFGGGMYVAGSGTMLSGNAVTANTASHGGGLYLIDSVAILNGNTITANFASYQGGGLSLYRSPARLSDNTVIGNTAESGGGLFLHSSDAVLKGNTVSSNTVAWHGGGLYLVDSVATLHGNIISANTAGRDGGGLELAGGTTTLNENTITVNTAEYGGGLDLVGNDAMLSRNIITNNVAKYGGGLHLVGNAAMLSGNTISANTAEYNGGGLYLSGSDAALANNLVINNQAGSLGSGLYIWGSFPHLRHTTVTGNSGGDGSGIYIAAGYGWGGTRYPSVVVLTNTILISHTVGLTVAAGCTVTMEATLWGTGTWASNSNIGGGGVVSHTRDVVGDPAFVNPGAGDYHIGPGSAAWNAGVDAGVTTDIDGDTRPDWCFPDLGVDELLTGIECQRFYLPLVTSMLLWNRTLLEGIPRYNAVPVGYPFTSDQESTMGELTWQIVAGAGWPCWPQLVWRDNLVVDLFPTPGFTGHCDVTIQVSDGISTTQDTFRVQVNPICCRVYLPLAMKGYGGTRGEGAPPLPATSTPGGYPAPAAPLSLPTPTPTPKSYPAP